MKYFFVIYGLLLALSASAQFKKTLYIADRSVFCGTKDCMQAKEKKKAGWNVFADSIKGFTYEEGYEYKISTDHSIDYNTWKLIKVISKKKTGYNPAVKLEGKKWVLLSMFDSNNSMKLGDSTIFINIDVSKGKVNGHGVCNKLKGNVVAEGKNIKFTELNYTKMKCVDQGNIMETIVSSMLEGSNTFVLQGHVLTLYSAKGSNMIFKE